MQPELQAKLLVLKVFYLGRSAEDCQAQSECRALAQKAFAALQVHSSPGEELLRRKLFYALLLAELERKRDPIVWRRAAKQLGWQLKELGAVDPFPYYLEVVKATTGLISSGDFGDKHRAPTQKIKTIVEVEKVGRFGPYTELYDFAADALDVSDEEREQFSSFLHDTSLAALMRRHRLGDLL